MNLFLSPGNKNAEDPAGGTFPAAATNPQTGFFFFFWKEAMEKSWLIAKWSQKKAKLMRGMKERSVAAGREFFISVFECKTRSTPPLNWTDSENAKVSLSEKKQKTRKTY